MIMRFCWPLICSLLLATMPTVGALGQASGTRLRRPDPSQGVQFVVRNPVGSVRIIAWERSSFEAFAVTSSSSERILGDVEEDGESRTITIAPGNDPKGGGGASLVVRLPRDSNLAPITGDRFPVTVEGLNKPIEIVTGAGAITVRGMNGSVSAVTTTGSITGTNLKGDISGVTQSGDIRLEGAQGRATATTFRGDILMRNIGNNVRVDTFYGKVDVSCAAGRVEVGGGEPVVSLAGLGGDVYVSTTGGKTFLRGSPVRDKTYRLKTLTGSVSVTVPARAAFQASLSSYTGSIHSAFQLASDPATKRGRKLVGTIREGTAQIELDSFSGSVHLLRSDTVVPEACRYN
jgi:hypothetical protein